MLGKGSEYILGLFYSDENTLVYDNINSQSLSKDDIHNLKVISFKFLGPLFMTLCKKKGWKIDYIETTLTPEEEKKSNETLLQSFTCLNSSRSITGSFTNLFTFIGSPYTEDISAIYERLKKYIHPSIIQGRIIAQRIYGTDFDYNTFIEDEIKRGTDLIEHTLGMSRKIYWEEKLAYSTIAVIKRTKKDGILQSDLYTYDLDDPLREEALDHIPSYYFMGILPDYYEKRMNETLKLFGKQGLYPNIIKVKVSNPDKEVLYIEEFLINSNEKVSYGLILIPSNNKIKESREIFYYKKKLRFMLDKKKEFERSILEFNSRINPFKNWSLNSEEALHKIERKLDIKK
jgi:hypothetical protein